MEKIDKFVQNKYNICAAWGNFGVCLQVNSFNSPEMYSIAQVHIIRNWNTLHNSKAAWQKSMNKALLLSNRDMTVLCRLLISSVLNDFPSFMLHTEFFLLYLNVSFLWQLDRVGPVKNKPPTDYLQKS